jgi:hypothetical protein
MIYRLAREKAMAKPSLNYANPIAKNHGQAVVERIVEIHP